MTNRWIKLLIFDIKGYFGYFRRIYSTTSSLSYTFPPRTTIAGLISSILGYDRDSYYEQFSLKNSFIALQIRSQITRIVQTVNYFDIDSFTNDKFRGKSAPAQIIQELLVQKLPYEQLWYRVFFNSVNNSIMEDLERRIKDKKFYYPPSLGTANNIANVEYVDKLDAELLKKDEEVPIYTIIPRSKIKYLEPQEERRIYIEERVPVSFLKGREIEKVDDYIYEEFGRPLKVILNDEIFKFKIENNEIYGVFM